MQISHRNQFAWVLAMLVIAGCQPSSPAAGQTPTGAILVFPTIEPTATALLPTAVLVVSPTSTPVAVLPTLSPTSVPRLPETSGLAMVFVSETVPDGANFQPGQAFQKTWTLKNGGARTWIKGFALARTSSSPEDEHLGSSDIIPLASEVKPGENLQISVDLVAPQQEGRYTVYFQLQDETGMLVPNSQIWVTITVGRISSPGPVTTGAISAQFTGSSLEGSEYHVSFCMQLPDSRAWFPWDVNLVINQQVVSPSGGRSDPATALTADKCFTFGYATYGDAPGGIVQLSIGKVTLDPAVHQDENCARAQASLTAEYPGLSFTCTGPGKYYAGLVTPPGMSQEKADKLIMDAMSSAIYGPWVLTIQ